MKRFYGLAGLAAVVLLGVAFARGNAGREVAINLGIVTLDSVPVTFVAFGGMVVGMAVVLVAGIRADLKVRRLLRERHMQESLTAPGSAPGAAPGTVQGTVTGSARREGDKLLE